MDFKYQVGQLVGYKRPGKSEISAIMLITDRQFTKVNERTGHFYWGNLVYTHIDGSCSVYDGRLSGRALAHRDQLVDLSTLDGQINLEEINAIFEKKKKTAG